ncbi:hypothetical protein SE17_13740 [Kouleothrix aurantiaca]|uniref:Uncharacterized protein n=1 Tax=Kouleothrix aurantiaca TaxID=186479 RepID=A0A0P9F837_9CHLR|nr:hypothetical protein SE17_13740 [Kouleothrix aurantiaca]
MYFACKTAPNSTPIIPQPAASPVDAAMPALASRQPFLSILSAILRNILKISAYYTAIRNTDLRTQHKSLKSSKGYIVAINRNPKRRAAGIASTKIVIASASIAATLGGWAAIGAMDTSNGANGVQAGALAQAPAQQQESQQDTLPNTGTPFGRHNRRGGERLPLPAPEGGESGGLGGTAPQTLPQDGFPGSDDQQGLPGTDDQPTQPQQQQLPQAQPQQPQQQTTPRVRTRSSR